MKKHANLLYTQTAILVGGTLFAWYQWYLEFFKGCEGCSGETEMFSKCFLGAIFFSLALLVNLVLVLKIVKKWKPRKSVKKKKT